MQSTYLIFGQLFIKQMAIFEQGQQPNRLVPRYRLIFKE